MRKTTLAVVLLFVGCASGIAQGAVPSDADHALLGAYVLQTGSLAATPTVTSEERAAVRTAEAAILAEANRDDALRDIGALPTRIRQLVGWDLTHSAADISFLGDPCQLGTDDCADAVVDNAPRPPDNPPPAPTDPNMTSWGPHTVTVRYTHETLIGGKVLMDVSHWLTWYIDTTNGFLRYVAWNPSTGYGYQENFCSTIGQCTEQSAQEPVELNPGQPETVYASVRTQMTAKYTFVCMVVCGTAIITSDLSANIYTWDWEAQGYDKATVTKS